MEQIKKVEYICEMIDQLIDEDDEFIVNKTRLYREYILNKTILYCEYILRLNKKDVDCIDDKSLR